jgi:hypothetical protein
MLGLGQLHSDEDVATFSIESAENNTRERMKSSQGDRLPAYSRLPAECQKKSHYRNDEKPNGLAYTTLYGQLTKTLLDLPYVRAGIKTFSSPNAVPNFVRS